jgi:hypothetical protein
MCRLMAGNYFASTPVEFLARLQIAVDLTA